MPTRTLPQGETVLMRAARTGTPAAIKVLVAHGADVNRPEGTLGETALMWAAAENNADAVGLLLELGADVNARSKLTEFPKSNAARTANALVSVVMPRGGWTRADARRPAGLHRGRARAGREGRGPERRGSGRHQRPHLRDHQRPLRRGRRADRARRRTRTSPTRAAWRRSTPPWTCTRCRGLPRARRPRRPIASTSLDVVKMLLGQGCEPQRAAQGAAAAEDAHGRRPGAGRGGHAVHARGQGRRRRGDAAAARQGRRSPRDAEEPHDSADAGGGLRLPHRRHERRRSGHRSPGDRGHQALSRARPRPQRLQRRRA